MGKMPPLHIYNVLSTQKNWSKHGSKNLIYILLSKKKKKAIAKDASENLIYKIPCAAYQITVKYIISIYKET